MHILEFLFVGGCALREKKPITVFFICKMYIYTPVCLIVTLCCIVECYTLLRKKKSPTQETYNTHCQVLKTPLIFSLINFILQMSGYF